MAGRLIRAGLVAVLLAIFVRTFLVQPFQVRSVSMEPALLPGDHILVNRFALAALDSGPLARVLPARDLCRGDVLVLRHPDRPRFAIVKRLAEMPETSDGGLFVTGDHSERSLDSRHWGPAPSHLVQGRAWLIYWSTADTPASRAVGQGHVASSEWGKVGARFCTRICQTRWHRSMIWVR